MSDSTEPALPGPIGQAPELAAVLAFLRGIGIGVSPANLDPADCVLPAIAIHDGALLYDPAGRGWIGDLLHEAGHLAVSEPGKRATLSVVEHDPAEEMATLAWSYAAAVAIGVPIEVLFHPAYKAGSQSLIDAFAGGAPIGLPMLQYWGMAARPDEDEPAYPAMRHWLRPAASP